MKEETRNVIETKIIAKRKVQKAKQKKRESKPKRVKPITKRKANIKLLSDYMNSLGRQTKGKGKRRARNKATRKMHQRQRL